MLTLFKVLRENFRQAFHALFANKLRSFLSLLGISIGIFCIIGVQAAAGSLETEVRGSVEKLGDNVYYVQQMPWNEDPGQNYWKYFQRPQPSYANYKDVKEKVQSAETVAYQIFLGSKTLKFRNSNVERVAALAVTEDYADMFSIDFEKGRWFTATEYNYAMNKVVIGHKVAEQLFGAIDPIGRMVKISGIKVEIIGVIKEAGESLIQISNYDEAILIPYETAKKIANVKSKFSFGVLLGVKAKEGIPAEQLKDELTGVLRVSRKLRPREENNFALNSISMLANALDNFFGSMNIASLIIGGFAIFVGMFSVANIMFVSVKERTNTIGIKKALGAKSYVILLEFLIEAIILCLFGGLMGLGIVYLSLAVLSTFMPYEMFLSTGNLVFGISLSIFIGVISGLIPAYQAANMDPVEAMRA